MIFFLWKAFNLGAVTGLPVLTSTDLTPRYGQKYPATFRINYRERDSHYAGYTQVADFYWKSRSVHNVLNTSFGQSGGRPKYIRRQQNVYCTERQTFSALT